MQFERRGLRAHYWQVFADALIECAIVEWNGGGYRCREAMNGWRLIVHFIIRQMQIGYEQQRSIDDTLSHRWKHRKCTKPIAVLDVK